MEEVGLQMYYEDGKDTADQLKFYFKLEIHEGGGTTPPFSKNLLFQFFCHIFSFLCPHLAPEPSGP